MIQSSLFCRAPLMGSAQGWVYRIFTFLEQDLERRGGTETEGVV